jgi:hypothetical protein
MESDEESELREENERQIALMVVDALWQSRWIRLVLEDYEYQRTYRFINLRTLFRWWRDSDRPNALVIWRELENLVLDKLQERQMEMWDIPKVDKRTITADDLFKPNRRRVHSYGRNLWEVSLTRDDFEVFEDTLKGQAEYEAYCKSKGVNPKDVVELDPV